MAYQALPQVLQERLDGSLNVVEASDDPIVLVLGTSAQGLSETFYAPDRPSDAKARYGTSGTLIRGMYEVYTGGARNIRLYRVGATAATLTLVGGGITIETVAKDDSAGTDYELFWSESAGRLRVWRASDDTLVYDNNPAYPTQAIDLGEVAVSGAATDLGTETDIGSLATPVTMADAHGEGGVPSAVYTAGTDGTALSRMEMYEALFNAYQDLEDQAFDVCVPMNVFLDDNNVMDLTEAQVTTAAIATLSDFPDAGATDDYLGKVYTEEHEGQNYFWWWLPTSPNAAADATFTADAGANMFPTEGSASATLKIDGTALTGSDFHEVNFGYQLANFCFNMSTDVIDMTGVIGVLPPNSYSPRDISNWVGKAPVTATSGAGIEVISTNGTGLLGMKWMAGRLASALDSGVPGHVIDGVDGRDGGGLIATDSGWMDGTQASDDNDALVDIGQYISVVAAYPVLANNAVSRSYVATGAPIYAGFYVNLPENRAPTNKVMPFLTLPWRVKVAKVDALANVKYVMFHQKPKGIVCSDSPTAARVESDFRRLSTVRITKACVDEVRSAAEPFLGGGMSDPTFEALRGRIDERLSQLVRAGYLTRYEMSLSATPTQRILGRAVLELVLVPAFELRRLTVIVSLAAI